MPIPPRADLDLLQSFAHRLADAARAAILPHFRVETPVANKAARGFDPVTEADRGAERAMRALIEAHFPDHGIIGEEFGETPTSSGWRWVLDPVDGTRAFIAGLPLWGTLIALTFEGQPIVGIIDQGYLDERYIGFPGGAQAHVRGATSRLAARPCARLAEAALATTDPYLFTPAEAGAFEHARATARLTRFGTDCYAYAMLARGSLDLVIEAGLKIHDVAALIPVVEGAGGVISNWRGAPVWGGGQVIAAGDRRVWEEALQPLRRSAA